MKVTILGCGTSSGVPLIGNNWGSCDPNNPRNRRLRVSLLVEEGTSTLLVDTSPDMRQQLLTCNLQKLDAVLYTHAHADHSHGIDDLRSVNWLMHKPIDIYADNATMSELEEKFDYIFQSKGANNFYKPALLTHVISGPFNVGDIAVLPFKQNHGSMHTLGYRFGDIAYSTDVNVLDENAFKALSGVKTWIVDCVREEPHPSHSHLAQTLEWIQKVKPERAYLTHMNHNMDYDTLTKKLPAGVWPAHDGLVLEC